jgi:hypothetical protein
MPAVIIRLECADTGQADQVAAAVTETGKLCYADGSGQAELTVTAVSVEA